MNYKKTIFLLCVSFLLSAAKSKGQFTLQDTSFNYVSDTIQTWMVPGCVTQVTVKLWAGGGGGGNVNFYDWDGAPGGSGSYYEGVLSGLTAGTVLDLYVPSGGKFSDTLVGGAGGWPGGGTGGFGSGFNRTGGGGGGYAAIQITGTWYVIAGAGGGSAQHGYYTAYGGSGGATTGGNGEGEGVGYWGGFGATITAGGDSGLTIYPHPNDSGSSGSAFQGGHGGGYVLGTIAGGGGGGGYYGGGGGGDYEGGGGGGSSYPVSTFSYGGITFTPISNLQGNAGIVNYSAPGSPPAGIGGGGYEASGENGLIIIIYEGGAPLTASVFSQTNPNCGVCNGRIVATASGGITPYVYNWSPGGQTSDSITGLCAGTYTLTVNDSCGNTTSLSVVLPALPLPVDTAVSANEKCYGDCIGIATAKALMGTAPYTYSWMPSGGSNDTATGLCAGIYTITVTDKSGCTGTATATITQPAAVAITSWTNNVVCTGGVDSAVVITTGGTLPYTYLWTPSGQTTDSVTGLSTGAYNVKVTDVNGCTESTIVNILHPPLFTVTMGAPTNVLCYGGVGSATVVAGGGNSPYTYLWTPTNETTATANGLNAGVYNVRVTDNNGCTATSSATITQPVLLTATISSVNNVLCYGDTGNVTVTAGGGTSPYAYLWTPTNQTTAMATGLHTGGYTITVTDHNGCTATTSAIITQPTLLTATISATNQVLCYGGTGNATVTAGGGTSPYIYLWTPTNQTTTMATGLAAGGYTITVSDHNGCSATATVTITQPTLLRTAMGTVNKIPCHGGVGSATVIASGGTIPYTYLWTPSNQSTATAAGLSVGSYSVAVKDKDGCTASASVTMTQPTTLTAAITSTTNISCFNGSNGAGTVRAGGGTTPYTYLWNPSGNTNANAMGLFAVGYTVTVSDSNGCTATASTTLTQPIALSVNISEPQIICKDSTGILNANASGGTTPYKYAWSTGYTSTNNTVSITPISTIYYTVTITDANGCTASNSITLQYGPSFAVNISGKNSVCTGDSTTICANAIGAIYGANYFWEPVNSDKPCIASSPKNTSEVYTVTVIDGCGSTTTASTTVFTEPSPMVNMYADFYQGCEPLCIQFRNSTTITHGGISQYIWDFGDGDTSRLYSPVYCYKSSGGYSVSLTVVSDSGCSATLKKIDMITVYSPPKAAFTYSPQSTTIENPTIHFKDESTDASDTSLIGGIVYRIWKFGDETDSTSNLQDPIHTYSDTGTYCATLLVMNSGGCTDTVTNCLVINPAFKLYIPSAFTPNGDGRNEVFKPVGQYIKSYDMYIFDRWGLQLYHTTDMNDGWDGKVNGAIAQEDVYIYKIMVMDSKDNEHSYVGNVTLLK